MAKSVKFSVESMPALPDALLLVIFDGVSDVKDIGRAACACKKFYRLLKKPARVLARFHGHSILSKSHSGTHLTWPVDSKDPHAQRDDLLLLLLSCLPELKLPSLFLRSLDVHNCQKLAATPFFVDNESNWTPASLHTLQRLTVHNSFTPVYSIVYGGHVTHTESAENLDQFMASLVHCTSLTTLQVRKTCLAAASLHRWTWLQSLQLLSLIDVSFVDARVITTEMQFVSQLTQLTRLDFFNSEEQLVGEFFPTLCHLSNLQELAVSCFNTEQFIAVASLPSLGALAVEYWQEQYEPEILQFLSTKLQVRYLNVQPLKGGSWRDFERLWPLYWPDKIGLGLSIIVRNVKQEEAALKAVRRMRSLARVFIGGVICPASLICLDGIQCCLQVYDVVDDQKLQKISWIKSLKHIHLTKCTGTAAGLSRLCLMLNLERVELTIVGDESLRSVLPRDLLEGQSAVRDED